MSLGGVWQSTNIKNALCVEDCCMKKGYKMNVYVAVMVTFALFLGGCSFTSSPLAQLEGELRPINTSDKYKIMIDKQQGSIAAEGANANTTK
jgi:hypothetical protein